MKTLRLQLVIVPQKRMQQAILIFILGVMASCGKENETPVPQSAEQPKSGQHTKVPADHRQLAILESFEQNPKALNDIERRAEAVRAVKEIGNQKQVEAVPVLLDEMFTIQPFSVDSDTFNSYPCSAALVQIGEPAAPQIQERFLKVPKGYQQLVLLETLIGIKGAQSVSDWLGSLKDNGNPALSEKERTELQHWVLSQLK